MTLRLRVTIAVKIPGCARGITVFLVRSLRRMSMSKKKTTRNSQLWFRRLKIHHSSSIVILQAAGVKETTLCVVWCRVLHVERLASAGVFRFAWRLNSGLPDFLGHTLSFSARSNRSSFITHFSFPLHVSHELVHLLVLVTVSVDSLLNLCTWIIRVKWSRRPRLSRPQRSAIWVKIEAIWSSSSKPRLPWPPGIRGRTSQYLQEALRLWKRKFFKEESSGR